MNRTDYVNSLNFEGAKVSIAKKLGINSEEVSIKPYKSGNFKVDLKNTTGNIGSLISGANKAYLTTTNLTIKKNKNKDFYYKADLELDLKNKSGEYVSTIGCIDSSRNKLTFSTANELKTN